MEEESTLLESKPSQLDLGSFAIEDIQLASIPISSLHNSTMRRASAQVSSSIDNSQPLGNLVKMRQPLQPLTIGPNPASTSYQYQNEISIIPQAFPEPRCREERLHFDFQHQQQSTCSKDKPAESLQKANLFESTLRSQSTLNPLHLQTSSKTPQFNQFQSTMNHSSGKRLVLAAMQSSESNFMASTHRSLASNQTVLATLDPHIISSPPTHYSQP